MILEEIKDLKGASLKQFLEDNSSKILEDKIYFLEMTDEQLIEANRQIAADSIALTELEHEKKEWMCQYKKDCEPYNLSLKANLEQVKRKQIEKQGTIYVLKDFDEGRIIEVDLNGNVVDNRKMSPSEKQVDIFNIKIA